MLKKPKTILLNLCAVALVAGGVLIAGEINNIFAPAPTMYTLGDIYNLIHNVATSTEGNHSLSPASLPTATSSYSVSQIYADLANLIQRENLATGTEYLGVTGAYGTPDPAYATTTVLSSSLTPAGIAGTATGYSLEDVYQLITANATTTAGAHDSSPATIPDSSLHSLSDIYTALTDLGTSKASKVKEGVTYLGQTGIYVPYIVTYDGNGNSGGTVPADPNFYASSTIVTVLDNTGALVKTGYDFYGWNTQADGYGDDFAPASTFTMGPANITLYARWTVTFTCGSSVFDPRDAHSYSTVLIGSQCWMQQNMNIGTLVLGSGDQGASCSSIQKYCYNDDELNCGDFGGLYQWNQAMCGETSAGAQGVCPTGWHIPTHDEFTTLERAVCTSGTCITDFPYDTTTVNRRGTNEGLALTSPSGFNAALGGWRLPSPPFFFGPTPLRLPPIDMSTWSSSEQSPTTAWVRYIGPFPFHNDIGRWDDSKIYGEAVRCLKD